MTLGAMRILFPAVAVGMAVFTSAQGWGFLNAVDVPGWLAVLAAVVVLDFVICPDKKKPR